jgi:hypothetical protein
MNHTENKTVGLAFSVSPHLSQHACGPSRIVQPTRRSSFIPPFGNVMNLEISANTVEQDALLGFNPLKYVNGWPVAQP